MRKSIISICMLVLGSVCFAVENQTYMPYGSFQPVNVVDDTSVAVTSYTVVKQAATQLGVQRIMQNTGSVNINFFYTLTSSSTVTSKFTLQPYQFYIENAYFGDIYWMCPAGTAAGNLTRSSVTNK